MSAGKNDEKNAIARSAAFNVRCATCGMNSSLPLRQDDQGQVACNSCFERWRFFDEEEYNRWEIIRST